MLQVILAVFHLGVVLCGPYEIVLAALRCAWERRRKQGGRRRKVMNAQFQAQLRETGPHNVIVGIDGRHEA